MQFQSEERTTPKIRIMPVDDNATFLDILCRFLRRYDELEVVGTAKGGEEALSLVPDLRPDVILLDLDIPDRNGLDIIPDLRELMPSVSIIVLTLLDSSGFRRAVLKAGSDDFVPKHTLVTDLIPAIRRSVAGESVNSNQSSGFRT